MQLPYGAVLGVPVHEAWAAFARPVGLRRWRGGSAEGTAEAGGTLRVHAEASAKSEAPGWSVFHVTAVQAPLLLVGWWDLSGLSDEERGLSARTQVVVRIEPLGSRRTRVNLLHSVFGKGAAWDALYERFRTFHAEGFKRLMAAHPVLDGTKTRADVAARLAALAGTWRISPETAAASHFDTLRVEVGQRARAGQSSGRALLRLSGPQRDGGPLEAWLVAWEEPDTWRGTLHSGGEPRSWDIEVSADGTLQWGQAGIGGHCGTSWALSAPTPQGTLRFLEIQGCLGSETVWGHASK